MLCQRPCYAHHRQCLHQSYDNIAGLIRLITVIFLCYFRILGLAQVLVTEPFAAARPQDALRRPYVL